MHSSQGHYISSIYRHLQIYLNQRFAHYGFGSGQYQFFSYIAKHEGVHQKELSDFFAIDKATTAKAVRKLCDLGYLLRKQDPVDGRYCQLYLSEAGKKIYPEIYNILKGTRSILQAGMSETEIQESLRLLDLMLGNILAETRGER